MNDGERGGDLGRLVPEAASLRLRVLAFVRDYFAQWNGSPSYGEIAAGLGTNRDRVRKSVKRLAADGLLLRGSAPRSLALPDSTEAAVRRLEAAGWAIDPNRRTATLRPLPDAPELDYFPPATAGAGDGAKRRSGGAA